MHFLRNIDIGVCVSVCPLKKICTEGLNALSLPDTPILQTNPNKQRDEQIFYFLTCNLNGLQVQGKCHIFPNVHCHFHT